MAPTLAKPRVRLSLDYSFNEEGLFFQDQFVTWQELGELDYRSLPAYSLKVCSDRSKALLEKIAEGLHPSSPRIIDTELIAEAIYADRDLWESLKFKFPTPIWRAGLELRDELARIARLMNEQGWPPLFSQKLTYLIYEQSGPEATAEIRRQSQDVQHLLNLAECISKDEEIDLLFPDLDYSGEEDLEGLTDLLDQASRAEVPRNVPQGFVRPSILGSGAVNQIARELVRTMDFSEL